MTEAITQIVSTQIPPQAETPPRVPTPAAPALAVTAPAPPANEATPSELQSAVHALAQTHEARQTDLRFQVDQVTELLVVSVIDRKDGKVILQMPSAEALSLAQSIENGPMHLLTRKA